MVIPKGYYRMEQNQGKSKPVTFFWVVDVTKSGRGSAEQSDIKTGHIMLHLADE